MKNPWLKKNPFMSMWLSTANAFAGKARAAGTAQVSRSRTSFAKEATRLWRTAASTAPKPKRRP